MPATRKSTKPLPGLTAGISEPDRVDAFLEDLDHPLKSVAVALRKLFLACDRRIGEGIYWNAPTFYFTGKMRPSDPKEYRRYVAGLNFYRKDAIRVIFLRGASAKDPSNLLEGAYEDGRRLASFASVAEVRKKQPALKKIVAQLVRSMK